MAITGAIPATSIHGTWTECVELWSIEDDTLFDLSSITEITLQLRDPLNTFIWLNIKMSSGHITIPAPGIIQWRVEADVMGTLDSKVYHMLLLLEDATDKVPLILGPLAVVE
jgi:hypothetical protein